MLSRTARARADLERVGANGLGDILELRLAHVRDGEVEPRLDLPVGVVGEADRAKRGDAFEPGRDVHPVGGFVNVCSGRSAMKKEWRAAS